MCRTNYIFILNIQYNTNENHNKWKWYKKYKIGKPAVRINMCFKLFVLVSVFNSWGNVFLDEVGRNRGTEVWEWKLVQSIFPSFMEAFCNLFLFFAFFQKTLWPVVFHKCLILLIGTYDDQSPYKALLVILFHEWKYYFLLFYLILLYAINSFILMVVVVRWKYIFFCN